MATNNYCAMSNFWNERYSEPTYVYGKSPNAFLAEQLNVLTPGRALFPAEGEGRNAAYAAGLGWQADAFDYSEAALRKAEQLFAEQGVEVDYTLKDITRFEAAAVVYDLIALCFVHLPPDDRHRFHAQCVQALRPGGHLVLEAFHKAQLPLSSGGPKQPALLFSEADLAQDFMGLELRLLERKRVVLDEGPYHSGEAEVIRFIGEKAKQ